MPARSSRACRASRAAMPRRRFARRRTAPAPRRPRSDRPDARPSSPRRKTRSAAPASAENATAAPHSVQRSTCARTGPSGASACTGVVSAHTAQRRSPSSSGVEQRAQSLIVGSTSTGRSRRRSAPAPPPARSSTTRAPPCRRSRRLAVDHDAQQRLVLAIAHRENPDRDEDRIDRFPRHGRLPVEIAVTVARHEAAQLPADVLECLAATRARAVVDGARKLLGDPARQQRR